MKRKEIKNLSKILEIKESSLKKYLKDNFLTKSKSLSFEQLIECAENFGKKKEDVGYCSTIAEMYEEKHEDVEPFILGRDLVNDLQLPTNPYKHSWISFNVQLNEAESQLVEENDTWENTDVDINELMETLNMDKASLKEKSVSEIRQLLDEEGFESSEWFETEKDRQSEKKLDFLTSELQRLSKEQEDVRKVYKEFYKLHNGSSWLNLESSDEELGTVEILFNEGLVEFKNDEFYYLYEILHSDLCRIGYRYHKSATADSSIMFTNDLLESVWHDDNLGN